MIDLPFATSTVLSGIRHGFFGRRGGGSSGDFSGNNMSTSVGDDGVVVEANRTAMCRQMSRGRAHLVMLRQVHSSTVLVLGERPDPVRAPAADAMVTDRPDLLLGILTADCAPVLLADPEAGVVGAAHAGWKGAVGNIVSATVLAMVGLGADPGRIRAAVGPTISSRNYEIGPETAAAIIAANPAAAAHIFAPGGGREHFDIPRLLLKQLLETGVEQVEDLAHCTYAQPEIYFSHRYATHHGIRTGRQISVIALR
jgi:YfiH family protein